MSTRFAAIAAGMAAAAAVSISAPTQAFAREKCVIANSHYPSWDALWWAQQDGIFKKWGDKYGVDISLTEPMKYIDTVNQFANGQFCGATITNMDALIGPAASGIDTVFEAFQDTLNGVKFDTITINGVDDEVDVLNGFTQNGQIIVTWKPLLTAAVQRKNAHLIFDSSKTPGRIVDGIAFNSAMASDNVRKAVVGAWYETVAAMRKDSPKYRNAVKWISNSLMQTVPEFEGQLSTTALFTTPVEALKFANSDGFKETMDKVRTWAAERGWLKNGAGVAQSKEYVGIRFPDGSIMGNAKNVKLHFDATYMKMAADGKL
jgi:NitT/TauT family transport system substrate-binding protein